MHVDIEEAYVPGSVPFPHLRKWRVAAVFAGVFLACALIGWLCFRANDEHWLNRVGGTLVVVSLAFTFWQLVFEWRREARQEIDPAAWTTRLIELGRSVEEAQQAARAVLHEQRRRLNQNRLAIVIIALGTAALGELLDSFGDIFAGWMGLAPGAGVG